MLLFWYFYAFFKSMNIVYRIFLVLSCLLHLPLIQGEESPSSPAIHFYDVIVIGSGAGTKLVRPVANKGYKVAIVEHSQLGGTCLNRGCIPSKMLIHIADLAMDIKKASQFFLEVRDPIIHFQEMMRYVASVTDKESATIAPLYAQHPNITFYPHHAHFLEDHVVQVGDTIITAPRIFITTGVEAYPPAIPGLDQVPYMTYAEALKCEVLPKKLLVIGGGYIAAELGYFYGAMGAETHFFVRDRMLSKEDADVRDVFEEAFSEMFHVHLHTEVKHVKHDKGVFTLVYEDPQTHQLLSMEGDALLVATGMRPLTKDLGLEYTHVQADKNGYIIVDEYLQTEAPGVFAFGDCIGKYGFRHSANYEGEYLFKTLFGSAKQEPIVYPRVPHAIFTRPQIASVGMTEETLQREGKTYLKGMALYQHSAMGMALQAERGFVKLLFDAHSHELIGAHIIGEEAATMIHIPIAWMTEHATLEEMEKMMYIHPALPEVIRNAVRQVK